MPQAAAPTLYSYMDSPLGRLLLVARGGALAGYAGGLHIKKALLTLERRHHPEAGAQIPF